MLAPLIGRKLKLVVAPGCRRSSHAHLRTWPSLARRAAHATAVPRRLRVRAQIVSRDSARFSSGNGTGHSSANGTEIHVQEANAGEAEDTRDRAAVAEALVGQEVDLFLRNNFTYGLQWWEPYKVMAGYEGVAAAAHDLWANVSVLSGLVATIIATILLSPNNKLLQPEVWQSSAFGLCMGMALVFNLCTLYLATILINKVSKTAPQNRAKWFATFGLLVDIPVITLLMGACFFMIGSVVAMSVLFNPIVATIIGCVASVMVYGVARVYRMTCAFEKDAVRAMQDMQ